MFLQKYNKHAYYQKNIFTSDNEQERAANTAKTFAVCLVDSKSKGYSNIIDGVGANNVSLVLETLDPLAASFEAEEYITFNNKRYRIHQVSEVSTHIRYANVYRIILK